MAGVVPDYELSWNNREEVLRLPVNPQDVPELYTPGNNQTWATSDVGTFMAIGHPGLKGTTVSSFFPNQDYPFCTYHDFPPPDECRKMLEKWQASERPIRLIITGVENDAFGIESLSFKQEIATGDLFFNLELQRYRFADDVNQQTNNLNRPGNMETGDTLLLFYQLQEGETLCELAERFLDDSDRYVEIAELNGIEDVGHPWAWVNETDPPRAIQIECESGTSGYRIQKEQLQNGVAKG